MMGYFKNLELETEDRGYDRVDGAICMKHVVDPCLLAELQEEPNPAPCSICGSRGSKPRASLETLMKPVMDAITFLYMPDPWESPESDRSSYTPLDVVQDVCHSAFDAEQEDLLLTLAKTLRSDIWIENYHRSSLQATIWGWEQFVQDVKSASRFVFTRNNLSFDGVGSPGERSSAFLSSLLPYVDNHEYRLVRSIPAGTPFYRGRLVGKRTDSMASAEKLGPAPADKASSNRMSPTGIPMFYASASPATAVKEIAAHGTERYARIGEFVGLRELSVLDLTQLPKLPSIFDKAERNSHGILAFVRRFTEEVTSPIDPSAVEELEYVPTQVVTEFFRWVPETRIDGIKLKSAQDGGDTFVLFFTASDFVDGPVDSQIHADTSSAPGPYVEDASVSGLHKPTFSLNPMNVHTYEVFRSVRTKLLRDKYGDRST